MKMQLAALAGAAALFAAGQAAAGSSYTFAVGDSYDIDFNGSLFGAPTPNLSAHMTLSLGDIYNGQVIFDYTITNTSTSPVTFSNISEIGFNISPNLSPAGDFFLVGAFQYAQTDHSVATPGLGPHDVCFTNQTGPCSNYEEADDFTSGLFNGVEGGGTLYLPYDNGLPTTVTVSDLYIIYSPVRGVDGQVGIGLPTGGVPEPASWALMLVGFGGLGAALRSRRRTALSRA